MKHLFLLAAILAFLGCNCSKQATKENTTTTTTTTTTTDTKYRFNVSFISIGAGTDTKAKKQFDQYLSDYEQKNKVKLEYEITPWGREGEVDYCFMLTALDKKSQEQFILETKAVLKSSSLVRYSENTPCQHKVIEH